MDHYDVLIIGGGQAATPLAHALAAAGRTVAVAERKWLGGSCVNFGCTPTKAALASARVAHLARRGGDYGLRIPTVQVDFAAVLRRAREMSEASRDGLRASLTASDNPRLIEAHARLAGREGGFFRVTAGERTLLARDVVLDTGTRSMIPPIEGLDGIDRLDSENWLDHPRLPSRLAMVGGGYIGLEMAQLYARMGAKVTILERGGQLASHEDPDVAEALRSVLEQEGIEVRLDTEVTRFARTAAGLTASLESGGRRDALEVSDVFLALGRRPNTDDLGLDTVGVKTDDKGFLEVDERLATRVQGIWAAGDVRGGPMFTHTSWDDHRILLSQLAGDGSRTVDRIVPYAIFTDPELGRVGLTESEARKQGRHVKVGRFDLQQNGKAKELGETAGFIKLVADAESGRLLGAAVLAPQAGELVHVYVTLMNADAPLSVIERAVFIHPTLAEAAQSAVSALR